MKEVEKWKKGRNEKILKVTKREEIKVRDREKVPGKKTEQICE